MRLRPYQSAMIEDARARLRGARSTCIVLPTGGGKGQMLAFMAKQIAERGLRALVMAHRIEICEQLVGNARDWNVRFGRIMTNAPFFPHAAPVQIGMAQTIVRRLGKLPKFDLIIVDEAHHAVVGSWRKIVDHYPDAKLVGFTATPQRLDGKGLGELFESLTLGPDMRSLIQDSYLAPYRYFVPAERIDLTGVGKRGGDFKREQVEGIVTEKRIVGNAVELYRKHFNGKQVIVFCATVAHGELMEKAYRSEGWRAGLVTGAMSKEDRAKVMADFRRGALSVLLSVDVISEGVDVPGVQGIQMLRPSASLTLVLQQVGRALRPKPDGSPAIILDHVDNASRHGLPDIEREWVLAGRTKRPAVDPVMCETCGRMAMPHEKQRVAASCATSPCGMLTAKGTGPSGPRKPIETVDGELAEVRELPYQGTMFKDFERMVRDAPTIEEAMKIAGMRAKKDGKPYRAAWVYRVRNEPPPWMPRRRDIRYV